MKTRQVLTALLCSLAAPAVQAQAWYLGGSVGIMKANVNGFDDATNAGVLAGYDVYRQDIFALSVEGEVTSTLADGDLSSGGSSGHWDVDTQAAYLAARIGADVYLKVRYGVLREDVGIDFAGRSSNDSDTGGSWGAALGWMFTDHWGVQLDGTLVEADLYYWNAGVRYQFR
jgi:hypothetical protein